MTEASWSALALSPLTLSWPLRTPATGLRWPVASRRKSWASQVTVALPAPYAPIVVNRYLIQKERDQQVVLYWYQSQGNAVAGEFTAKIEMVRSAIIRNRTDGALVRVSAPVTGGAAETTESLVRYVQALYPILSEYLPE